MRLRALHLVAFGPFRNKTLRFQSDGAVEVVFGPNEAGKSTTRRAVLGLLFGIPHHSKDGHTHGEAVVGATLEGPGGRTIEVVRRKGRKNTLFGADKEPIDEQVIAGLVSGMDVETYELTCGLDHELLRKGGSALRTGNGQLGESLFSAATGLSGLHGVLVSLREEADALLGRGAAKRPLNEAQRAFAEAKKLAGTFATSADTWLEQQKRIEKTRADLEALKKERTEAAETRSGARAIAAAARAHEAARARLAETEQALGATRAELAAIEASPELLARAQAIADLQERLGSHRKAQVDRPRVAAELEAIEERARRASRDAPKGAASELPAEAHVRKLALDGSTLRERARQLESREADIASALERAEQRLAKSSAVKDASALREALDAARREGDVETRLASARELAKREHANAAARASAIGFGGTLEELVALPVPATDVVATHARAAARLADEKRAIAARRRELEEERAEAERAVGALHAEGEVPTEEALARARAERDAQWDAIRESGKPAPAAASKFERAVHAADELADRLRREAARVTRLHELEATLATIARKLELEAERARALDEDAAAAARAWESLWSATRITPRAPEEMTTWVARHREAVTAAQRAMEAEAAVAPLAAALDRARAVLSSALEREGETVDRDASLEQLAQHAKRVVSARDKALAERAALESARETAERDRERAARDRAGFERDNAAWKAQWAACARSLGLPEDASPEQVTSALDALAALSRIEDEAEKVRRRLSGIDRDAARFAEDVRAVCAACAPELRERPVEEAAAELDWRVRRATENRARRETLEEHERKLDAQTREARAAAEAAAEALKSPEDAEAAESRAIELDARIGELDDRIQQTSRELGSVESGAKQFDQSPAIEQAAEAQRQLARVRELAERYARARLAAAAVSRLLERYRRENQGPVLARASALFAMLTLGSFEGLEVGFGEDDEPVLVAVREGRRLEASALSDGTLDQLYLALRVASLERLVESRGALPLLLDDVLVHFDDQRAAAALAVLSELAKKTQVILFTHHARIVDIARRAMSDRDAKAAGIHELGP